MKHLMSILLAVVLVFLCTNVQVWAGDSDNADREDADYSDRADTWDGSCRCDAHAEQFRAGNTSSADLVDAWRDGDRDTVVALTNRARKDAGVSALTVDVELQTAAQIRANEIAERFSHTRPDGSKWHTVSDKVHGENLAMGFEDGEAVVDAWMGSSGHRRNILDSGFKKIGTASIEIDGVVYWVQLFGRE
ncbi:CAP domain-containing protein [Ruminococcaceae bacterium OttesenSCG-928-L11]|nr:CAP domain-containing protein [Ruminococcaceae bacterium OttesenSCG-928-L11]